MSRYEFDAEIQEGRGGGAWVKIPFDVPQALGTRGRVPVKASFDGQPYRGSIAPMGGCYVLGVTKAIRQAIGKSIGDPVHVVLEPDTEPRTVALPDELAAALAVNPQARQTFESLAYTHQREYVQWITAAKKDETRQRRVKQAIERLSASNK